MSIIEKIMKILVLNPQWHAEHPLVKLLSQNQITVLCAPTTEEAWLILQMQGETIDLCLINRELQKTRSAPMSPPVGVNDGGLAFLQQIRRFQGGRSLPVIITSEYWKNRDFLAHGKTDSGAEAYLALPCTPEALLQAIRPFGEEEILESAPPVDLPQKPAAAPAHADSGFEAADYDVMKMYLMLREKDVLMLSNQVKDLNRDLYDLKQALRRERMKGVEFQYRLEQEQRRGLDLEKDNRRLAESLQTEQDLQSYRQTLVDRTYTNVDLASVEAPTPPRMPEAVSAPVAAPAPLPEDFSKDFDDKSIFILKGKSSAASN